MESSAKFSVTTWLIITIASIGFLFDTYELLMTPLVAPPAIAELLKVPISHPSVTTWTGNLLWISALCGGVFGLWGGWLIDRLGRKTVMGGSIFLYSFSPLLAAFSTTLPWFIFFRSTTFIGVCVEFIAAITWLAEVFEDKKQREKWLGITQAFASLGGVLVTLVAFYVGRNRGLLADIDLGLPKATDGEVGTWRYILATGLFPAIPIALMLPFVPESRIWKEKRAAGALQRPKISQLFAPQYIRVTLVTAMLSACAYGIAFGALQLTPRLVTPGLPEMKHASDQLRPLRAEAKQLNEQFDAAQSKEEKAQVVGQLKSLAAKQKAPDAEIKEKGESVQLFQEMGGLIGRILLAVLVIIGISRVTLLRLFQVPALILLPLTYFMLYKEGGSAFMFAYGVCGLLTVAQFSYFGEYLPKVFPLHLRGTGGSFATNVGGRMIGTSMSVVTTSLIAPLVAGDRPISSPDVVAQAAGIVATSIAVLALIIGLFLPEPQAESVQ